MKKYISTRIRDTEEIKTCEQVSVWIKEKARECYLTLISNLSSEFELA